MAQEEFAATLGVARRTVATWHEKPDVVLRPELQRTLDTAYERAAEPVKIRFVRQLKAEEVEPNRANPGDSTPADRSSRSTVGAFGDGDGSASSRIDDEIEARLAEDRAISEVLTWLDDCAGWLPGSARRRVAQLVRKIDVRQVRDQAQSRSGVGRGAIAEFLRQFYGPSFGEGYGLYQARVAGVLETTSVLARSEWLDQAVPLGGGQERFTLDGSLPAWTPVLDDETAASAAAERLAVGLATNSRIFNSVLYRLVRVEFLQGAMHATLGLTDFAAYALTMDLMENETIDAIVDGPGATSAALPLRKRYLPSLDSVTRFGDRLCVGGPLALFAAARPPGRSRPNGDFVLLLQQRSGRVLNAANRLAVIPKGFHQPLVDLSGEVAISSTLDREMEEELFGRLEVDSTDDGFRRADPLHAARLTLPLRWLVDHPRAWRMECTGFGLNLVSGNFEFASLIVVEDQGWWEQFGGSIAANWESDSLRQYSSLDRELIDRITHNAAWSNEGLFAFLQGVKRLAQIGGDRVLLPTIEWEL